MQCRGINRKDCSQVTDFGNFGFQSLLRRLGVLEKKLKVGSAAPRRLSIFFPKPPTSGAGFETKISKVRHLRAVFTLKMLGIRGYQEGHGKESCGHRRYTGFMFPDIEQQKCQLLYLLQC